MPPKKGAEFEAADEAWKRKGQPKNFKLQGQAQIEGAHTKYFYTDESGGKWLFEPAAEEFRAHGDEVAYRIGRLVDPEAVEVRVIELDGKVGSIQKWKTGLAAQANYAGVDPASLSPGDVEQLQREHVVAWLISNHDGHGNQFLRMRDGRVHGLDKGHLFKLLGEDKLSVGYHPNRAGESEPYYNTLFRAALPGQRGAEGGVLQDRAGTEAEFPARLRAVLRRRPGPEGLPLRGGRGRRAEERRRRSGASGRRPGREVEQEATDWTVNRIVESGVAHLDRSLLEYHQQTISPYEGMRSKIVETDKYPNRDALFADLLKGACLPRRATAVSMQESGSPRRRQVREGKTR